MQRVIVTVRRADETRLRDLEVPADIDAGQLANMVADALRWQGNTEGGKASYTIEAHPLGRIILPGETLAGAGVWDGSWLVFHPVAVGDGRQEAGGRSQLTPATRHTPQYAAPLPAPPPPRPYAYASPEQISPPQPAAPIMNSYPAPDDTLRSDEPAFIASQPQPQPSFKPSAPTVTGWRSLGLDLPALPPVAQAPLPPQAEPPPIIDKPKASSFVWKQVDE